MKTSICASVVLCASLIGSGAAVADEGFYYGVALGYSDMQGTDPFGKTSGDELTFGGVLGYRFEYSARSSLSVEGSIDATTQNLMAYDSGVDACTDNSPGWCEVHAVARLRGVYGFSLSNGIEILSMAGAASVVGIAEDGPGNYADTTAFGYTLGVGAQKQTSLGMARLELTYDNFDGSTPNNYEKTLEILSLRAVLMF